MINQTKMFALQELSRLKNNWSFRKPKRMNGSTGGVWVDRNPDCCRQLKYFLNKSFEPLTIHTIQRKITCMVKNVVVAYGAPANMFAELMEVNERKFHFEI